MPSIGSLTLDMLITDRMTGPLGRVEATVTRVAARMNAVLAGVGQAFGQRLITAIEGMAKAVVVGGADFESSMQAVRAVVTPTEKEFQRLNKTALEFGQQTAFNAIEVAGAMQELGQAGFKTEQVLAALPATLNLAAAGGLSVADASRISAAAMNNLGLAATDLGRVADVFTVAAIDSATNVQELGVAMRYAGPISATFGKSLEEIIGPLMALGQAGITGSMAGTGLRQVFSKLAGENKRVNDLLAELNLNVDRFKGLQLADQLDVLARAMGRMDETERAAKLMFAFGERAGPTMAALLNQGSEAIRKYQRLLGKSGGKAELVADIRMDAVKGAAKRLSGALFTLREKIFEALAGSLRVIIEWSTNAAKWLTEKVPAAVAFLSRAWDRLKASAVAFAASIEPITSRFGGLRNTLIGLGAAFATAFVGIPAATALLSAMAGIVTTLAGGAIPLLIGGLVALAAKFAYAQIPGETFAEKMKWVAEVVSEAWEKAKDVFVVAVEAIGLAIDQGKELVQDWGTIVEQQMARAGGATQKNAKQTSSWGDRIGHDFTTAGAIIANWKTVIEVGMLTGTLAVVRFANQAIHFFGTVIPSYVKWFADNFVNILRDLDNAAGAIITNMAINIWDFLVEVASWLAGDGFDFKWTGLLEGFQSTLTDLPKILERHKGDLEVGLEIQVEDAVRQLDEGMNRFGERANKALNKRADEKRRDILGPPKVPSIIGGVADAAKSVVDGVKGAGEAMWDAAVRVGEGVQVLVDKAKAAAVFADVQATPAAGEAKAGFSSLIDAWRSVQLAAFSDPEVEIQKQILKENKQQNANLRNVEQAVKGINVGMEE